MTRLTQEPLSPADLARRYVWWQDADTTLRDIPLLLCQIMHLGTARDYVAARSYFGEAAFRSALTTARPGAMDERSWHFWHLHFGIPSHPMPRRDFVDARDARS